MATIGSLAVNLVARTEKFSGGLTKARKDLKLFGGAISSAKSLMLGFGATLAAGFTISGLRSQIDDIDDLSDAAERLQVNFEKLQGLRFAAKLGGADQGSLLSGLAKMRRGLEDNSKGFAQIGLDIRKLKQMKGEDVFLSIADAMAKTEDANKRLSAARKIFGGAGGDLMPTLLGGSAGISAAAAKVNPVSMAEAQRVKKVNDDFDELSQRLGDTAKQLIVKLEPAIKAVTDGLLTMSDWLPGGKSRADNRKQATYEHYVDSLSKKHFTEAIRNRFDEGNPDLGAALAKRAGREQAATAANRVLAGRSIASAPGRGIEAAISGFAKLAGDGADCAGQAGAETPRDRAEHVLGRHQANVRHGPVQSRCPGEAQHERHFCRALRRRNAETGRAIVPGRRRKFRRPGQRGARAGHGRRFFARTPLLPAGPGREPAATTTQGPKRNCHRDQEHQGRIHRRH